MPNPLPASAPEPSPAWWRFELRQLWYAMIVMGAAVATFGWWGLAVAAATLAAWAVVFFACHGRAARLVACGGLALAAVSFAYLQFGYLLQPRTCGPNVHCEHNLRQIGEALRLYRRERGYYPKLRGDPPLVQKSWRVAILPQLGLGRLHEEYDENRSWEDQKSEPFTRGLPDVYRPNDDEVPYAKTPYLATGEFSKVTDVQYDRQGLRRDVLVVESTGLPVFWAEPADFESPKDAGNILWDTTYVHHLEGDFFREPLAGTHVLLSDGSVEIVPSDLPSDVINRMMAFGCGCDEVGPWLAPRRFIRWGNILRLAAMTLLVVLPVAWIFHGEGLDALTSNEVLQPPTPREAPPPSPGQRTRLIVCLVVMIGMLAAGFWAWAARGVSKQPYGYLLTRDTPPEVPTPGPVPDYSEYWDLWHRTPDACAEVGHLYGRRYVRLQRVGP